MIHQLLNSRYFWLGWSLLFAVSYSGQAMTKAFASQALIQDDARQYLFWMFRFFDPDLFPNDLIADYFQSVTPEGYASLYRFASWWGISPLLLHKLLPLLLALILTGYGFFVTLKIFPVPLAGFSAMLLLNQSLWFQDDLASATPRAFVYPLFLAFLYYFLSRNMMGTLGAIALLGTFYPQYVILSALVLLFSILSIWQKKITDQKAYQLAIFGGVTCFLILLPYALTTSEFQPVITREQALTLPEFSPDGRASFFYNNPLYFWLFAERSGLIPALMPPLIWMGLFLPIFSRFPTQFPRLKLLKRTEVLQQVLLASFVCWLTAHLLLFRLHLPSRYTDHSGRMVMAIAGGITIALLVEGGIRSLQQKEKKIARGIASFVLGGLLIFYPVLSSRFPMTNYRPVDNIALYQFFKQQPKATVIVSLTPEAHYIPTFAQRSILIGEEYAIPYHWGYYREFRERAIALITAQYTSDPTVLNQFIQDYNIDFFLLEENSFSQAYLKRDWLQQYSKATQTAITDLEQGQIPLLRQYRQNCTVFREQRFTVLSASCILKKGDG
ncbi:MAG: hypothetical protein GVY17_15305 [Cyanobacteria bacterium]|jgi:hypothetical protein|nr:hypothetical protein [Cyanobacteria bacterium GSL.Bin21]